MTKSAETATTETLTYTRYSNSTYEASGVGWLGGIPVHWEVDLM